MGCGASAVRSETEKVAFQNCHRAPHGKRAPKLPAWSDGKAVANFDSVGPKAVGHRLVLSSKVLDLPAPAEAADIAESSMDAVAWSSWNSSTWDKTRSGPSPPTRRDHERHLSKLNAARRNIECVPDLFSEIVSSKRSKANEDFEILSADVPELESCGLPGRGRLELSLVVRQEPKRRRSSSG
ncbi:hypothetical protein AK812_SmicGene13359 [Symbiodinium microadriaticum]|uniref:Uncharacterized protein n=1 Tax=Symbiodinium microadriaticum TaxID=2951 RepID=A0A1Q9E8B3_SYMMI|nr:hypothetical protein AK812_SmicGene13359 [Symbiodinium microadriaticum]